MLVLVPPIINGRMTRRYGWYHLLVKPFLYAKKEQAEFVKTVTEAAEGHKQSLKLDFSENVTIHAQAEIQDVHWTHKQATLFTALAFLNETDQVSYGMPLSLMIYVNNNVVFI